MDNKQIAEASYKLAEYARGLVDDPAQQVEILMNASSFVQNQVTSETIRQALYKILNP